MSASSPVSPRRASSRRFLRYLAGIAVVVLFAFAGTAGWYYLQMRGSLAQLDGEGAMPGATAAIVIERDALGIPTIIASSRADVARGLGFVHAQDRFFQMDLARRRAAGELSELLGSAALKIDTRTRLLRLRARARRTIEVAPPEELAVLRAYVEGVNAGLSALAVKPPEYLALRMEPRAWAAEDSVLILASMFLTLQDAEARRESRLAAVYATLPPPLADFITSSSSEWETPLVAGSNGDVAWAFTNSAGDWSDLVILEHDPADPNRYRTPSGMLPIAIVHETIEVKGNTSVPVEIRETIWGPVVDHDSSGHER